jgi:alpha-tubulin suppressor-like RCC1 family protein
MTRFACTRWFTPFQLAVTALPFACAIDSRVFPAPDPAATDLSVRPIADGGGPSPEGRSDGERTNAPDAGVSHEQTCPPGQHACGGVCANDDDPRTCGQGCSPCAAPAGGAATCDGAICGTACPSGTELCNGACIDATAPCSDSCPSDTRDCGGLCVALDSLSACGPACAPCPVPVGGEATCTMGLCGGQCPSDQQFCDGACIPRATCCTPCTDAFACRDGTCPSTCTSDDDCIADHFCDDGQCIGRVIQLAAGSITPTACSLHSDGLVRCWGYAGDGEFGDASGPGPVVVPLPMAAKQIAIGNRQVCAVMSDASLWCWGDVLIELVDNYIRPAPYPGLTNVASVALSGAVGGCVAHADGNVSCWGLNSGGLLGRGTNDDFFSPPGAVPGLSDVVQIERGEFHVCARRGAGAMSCWGDNSFGTVGFGTLNTSTLYIDPRAVLFPSTVSSIANAKQIAAGSSASFALLGGGATDGVLMAWGLDSTRGTGDAGPQALATPTRLGGATLFRAVSAGGGSGMGCGITSSGAVQCWGLYTLNGEILQDLSPVEIVGVENATALGVGGGFACALVGATQILCWGDNSFGQLGTTGPGSMRPTAVVW